MTDRQKRIASFVLVVGLFIVTLIGRIYIEKSQVSRSREQPPVAYQKTVLMVGDVSLTALIADSEALRTQGLSGTQSLEKDRAMLFVFEKPGIYPFWMKEMRYPIDIIWLDEAKHVVFIKENATPESFPEAFTNTQPAKYVVEVVAGFAKEHGVEIGTTMLIELGIR